MSSDTEAMLARLWESQSDRFINLVMAAELDPATDFVGANFAGMSLAGETLDRFNFEGADFRECDIAGAVFRNCTLQHALFATPPVVQNSSGFEIIEPGDEAAEIAALMRDAEESGRQEDRTAALRKLAPHASSPRVADFFRDRALFDEGQQSRNFAANTLRSITDNPAQIAKEIAFGRLLSRERRYGTTDRFISAYLEDYGDDDDIFDRIAMLASDDVPYRKLLSALPEHIAGSPTLKQMLLTIAQGGGSEDAQTAAIDFLAKRYINDLQIRAMLVRLTSMPSLRDDVQRALVTTISYDAELTEAARSWLVRTIAMSPYIRYGFSRALLLREANPSLLTDSSVLAAYLAATTDSNSTETRQSACKALVEFTMRWPRPEYQRRPYDYQLWNLVHYGHDPQDPITEETLAVLADAYSVTKAKVREAFKRVSDLGVALFYAA
jgi:hypothetical protein